MSVRRENRGAALVIVVFIMTILLLVALTFFTATRLEVNSSRSVIDGLRASFLADAGAALATAFLNYDYAIHQMYTSTDHAWRTYFNGSWAAGKPWAWVRDPQWAREQGSSITSDTRRPLTSGGVPEIMLDPAGVMGARGVPNIADMFYVPRIQGSSAHDTEIDGRNDPMGFDSTRNPFAVTTDFELWPLAAFLAKLEVPLPQDPDSTPQAPAGVDPWKRYWPEQQIHTFTDVDNDGDGYRDSIWIPIGADVFNTSDGIDNDLDGIVDEGAGADGIDNDDDGLVDEDDELSYSDQSEPCVFVYWGGNDGLDNDGDGVVDEDRLNGNTDPNGRDEQRIFLTAPVHSPYGSNFLSPFRVHRSRAVDSRHTSGDPAAPYDFEVDPRPGSPTVDVIDNDYNLVVNDHIEYFPLIDLPPGYSTWEEVFRDMLGDPAHLANTAHLVNPWLLRGMTAINGIYLVYSSGEPVCELVGRVAVEINDESSKVNLNVAGGHAYNRNVTSDGETSNIEEGFNRVLSEGSGPGEYETRALPGIGLETAADLWALLSGAPKNEGFVLSKDTSSFTPEELAYAWDVCTPGYGRVDDDGSALLMAMDGIDNDGDGLIDEGFRLPVLWRPPEDYNVNPDTPEGQLFENTLKLQGAEMMARYDAQKGMFEGIDDSSERRLFRSYRNRIAEDDFEGNAPIDNDGNGISNEIGELADRALGTIEQLGLARNIGDERFEDLRRLATVYSSEPDVTFLRQELGAAPEISGIRLNYNFAQVYEGEVNALPEVTDMLFRDWSRHYREPKFLRLKRPQLKSYDSGWAAPAMANVYNATAGYLRWVRLGLWAEFAKGLRQEDTTLVGTMYDQELDFLENNDETLPEVTMIADNELRAFQLAATLRDNGDTDHARTSLKVFADPQTHPDPYWERMRGAITNDTTRALEPKRAIEHTITGIESIRVTEMMVRPVRRVEAEMLMPVNANRVLNYSDPVNDTRYFDPNNLFGCLFDLSELGYTDETTPASPYLFWLNFDMVSSFVSFEEACGTMRPTIMQPWRPKQNKLGQVLPLNPMGPNSAIMTSCLTAVSAASGGSGLAVGNLQPNVMQFRFGPSAGLPPGRYYLMLNSKDENGVPTITARKADGSPSDNLYDTELIEYAIKYGTASDTFVTGNESIFADIQHSIDATTDPDAEMYAKNRWQRNAKVGYENMTQYAQERAQAPPTIADIPSGFVWLPSYPTSDTADIDAYGYGEDVAYTVQIPPYAANPLNQLYLYVAIRINPMLNPTAYAHTIGNNGLDDDGDNLPDDADEWFKGSNGVDDDDDNNVDDADEQFMPYFNLAVNWFDFSQEPDHEWIELTNIAAYNPDLPAESQAIDLTNWYFELGPTGLNGITNPENPKFTIKQGTADSRITIAPGGRLLIGFNKYDYGFAGSTVPAYFGRNYIGLATLPPDLYGVAEQPLFETRPLSGVENAYITVPPLTLMELAGIDDLLWNPDTRTEKGGSVFERRIWARGEYRDFVDYNGDGIADPYGMDDTVISTPGNGFPVIDLETGTAVPGEYYNAMKAWDRIVEADVHWPGRTSNANATDLHLSDINESNGVDQIAWLILRGGVLPNYPEQDGFDNDGDGLLLESDGVDNNGNQRVLSSDDEDNNGNNLYDEPYEGIDEPGEGVDENRWWKPLGYDTPGSFGFAKEDPADALALPITLRAGDPLLNGYQVIDEKLSWYSGREPYVNPAWREFIERRFYPGDCVILTLRDASGKTVDSVTYTERDVVNRSIDDGVSLYNEDLGANIRTPLNIWYDSMWPENTMGIDFYRTLERKHPLYQGDRFGTQNRWQATDGYYDDWDNSMVWWCQDPNYLNPATWPVLEYRNAIMGSPLEMGLFERRVEGKGTLALKDMDFAPVEYTGLWRFMPGPGRDNLMGFIADRPYRSGGDVVGLPHLTLRYNYAAPDATNSYTHANPSQPFGPLKMGRPGYGYETGQLLPNGEGARQGYDFMTIDEVLLGDRMSGELLAAPDYKDRTNDKVVPTGFPVDLIALTSNMGVQPIELSVAQSEQPWLYSPAMNRWVTAYSHDDETTWTDTSVDPLTRGFTPVYLFSFDGLAAIDETAIETNALFNGQYLMNTCPGFAAMLQDRSTTEIASLMQGLKSRWTQENGLDLRRVAYYTGDYGGDIVNGQAVDKRGYQTAPADYRNPAISPMAMFAWQADAGIENGEYDVYLGLGDTLVDLREQVERENLQFASEQIQQGLLSGQNRDSEADNTPMLTTGMGKWLMQRVKYEKTRVLAKCYTDPKFYRNPGQILDGGNLKEGEEGDVLTPDVNGIAYYGRVKVTNNFLALVVRNWSNWTAESDEPPLCLFTRVILSPRDRVAGRINVNTAATQPTTVGDVKEWFNALMGIPGFLPEYNTAYTPTSAKRQDVLAKDANLGLPGETPANASTQTQELPKGEALARMDNQELRETLADTPEGSLYLRARTIMNKRPEWPDGRYYRQVSDLLGYTPYYEAMPKQTETQQQKLLMKLFLAGEDDTVWNQAGTLALSPAWYAGETLWAGTEAATAKHVYPLISPDQALRVASQVENAFDLNAVPAALRDRVAAQVTGEINRLRFNEERMRYERAYNLMTTRSDVFEILVTAQAGYGSDANGDGRINYRDPEEFVIAGEKKIRTVYNR